MGEEPGKRNFMETNHEEERKTNADEASKQGGGVRVKSVCFGGFKIEKRHPKSGKNQSAPNRIIIDSQKV